MCAGKSSVLPFVATGLGTYGVDLDEIAEPYYEEVGFGRSRHHELGAQLAISAPSDGGKAGILMQYDECSKITGMPQ